MPGKEAPFKRLMNGYDVDKNTGCWVWRGQKSNSGYGLIKVFGKMVSAHRYSYSLHYGDIADGMEILHSCDVKECINPDHLRIGTHAENMAEAAQRGRMRSGSSHPMWRAKVKKPRQSNIVEVLGKTYESQKEAERQLGLGSGTVRYWIKHHPHKAKVIKKGELNGE